MIVSPIEWPLPKSDRLVGVLGTRIDGSRGRESELDRLEDNERSTLSCMVLGWCGV
jgi:hypothetical protein